MLEKLHDQLLALEHLTEEQVFAAVDLLVNAAVPADAKARFLGQLAAKGETIAEIAGFARAQPKHPLTKNERPSVTPRAPVFFMMLTFENLVCQRAERGIGEVAGVP